MGCATCKCASIKCPRRCRSAHAQIGDVLLDAAPSGLIQRS
jgi:hypothetical protein